MAHEKDCKIRKAGIQYAGPRATPMKSMMIKKRILMVMGMLAAALFASCQSSDVQTEATQQQSGEQPVVQTSAKTSPKPGKAVQKPGANSIVTDKPIKFVPSVPGRRISRVSVPGKYVALTFDDGPHASLTPKVLDILARHNAKATFFVLGDRASRNPSILARAVAQGSEIGSHTWNHVNLSRSSLATVKSELDRTAAAIQSATGRAPRIMRPPYGACNSTVLSYIYEQYGTPAILWDVDTNDWRKPGVQTVINRAVQGARPGSIILLHDIHSSSVAAVEGIVTGLQARGFTLVTVSELIRMGRAAAGVSPNAAPAPSPAPSAAPAAPVSPAPADTAVTVPSSPVVAPAAQTSAAPASSAAAPVTPVVPEVPAVAAASSDAAPLMLPVTSEPVKTPVSPTVPTLPSDAAAPAALPSSVQPAATPASSDTTIPVSLF